MKISRVSTFILHVPVTGGEISDSTHTITHWGAPGVIIETDEGILGYGFTGTHAHLATDRLIVDLITHVYGPLLIGMDPRESQSLWSKLFHHPATQWVGRGGITHLALAAVDIALWDIKAKVAGQPLWHLLGGGALKRVEAYSTDSGWLNWPTERLVAEARQLIEEQGYSAVKIKVGSPVPRADLDRVEAVRKVIGSQNRLMVDANGRWDLPTAIAVGRRFADYDVYWFEEPIWYDDVVGHARLARQIDTSIAVGEQLYTIDAFRSFIRANAVHLVQADAVRLGGITEWWQVADLALASRLPVVPHIGDMAQVHLHLCIAHPSCNLLEYIPWLRQCFEEPATVQDGYFTVPVLPGAGTTLSATALEEYGVT